MALPTRPYLFLAALFIGLTISLGLAFSQTTPTVSHLLSQIAKKATDSTAVDSTGSGGPGLGGPNNIIDNTEQTPSADTADTAPCAGVTGTTAGSPCATGFAAATRTATLLVDKTATCLAQCSTEFENCNSRCKDSEPCFDACEGEYAICQDDCYAGKDNTYNSCTTECSNNGEVCTAAWQTYEAQESNTNYIKAVSCDATAFARDCRCLKTA